MHSNFKRCDLKLALSKAKANSEEDVDKKIEQLSEVTKEKIKKLAMIRGQHPGATDVVWALLLDCLPQANWFLLGYVGKRWGNNLELGNKYSRTGGMKRAGIDNVAERKKFYEKAGIPEDIPLYKMLEIIKAEAEKPNDSSAFSNAKIPKNKNGKSIKEEIVLVCEQLLAL